MNPNFKKVKLGDICLIESGGTPSSKVSRYWYGGNILWVTLPDLKTKYINNTNRKITETGLNKSSAKLLPKNTVIFSSRATIGEVAIAKKEVSTNQGSKNFICNPEKIYYEFLYYLLIAKKSSIKKIASGATYKEVNKTVLSKYEVDIPSILIQQKIASVLSTYDNLIENNTRRIEILEEMAQRIYKEWFINQDFEMKSILEIPYFTFLKQNINSYEGYKKYFATADVQGTNFVKDGIDYEYNNKPSRAQKQPLVNSVWFARMKDSYKIAAYTKVNALEAENSMLSSGFAGLSSKNIHFGFLYTTISNKIFDNFKNLYSTGATQISLNNSGLRKIQVPFPEEKIVLEFCNIINPIIDKSLLLKKLNKNLIKTRDYLLPKLISGKVDVSDLEINTDIIND